MLRSLDIRDMLIIDRLELEFQSGLNVLTGETGAGKSILLDALGFVLGWRGRAELVRQGAEQGEVTAEFNVSLSHAASGILEEAGIPFEEGALVFRRVNRKDGRKTAWVNGVRVSGEVLRQLSDELVELHGQNDDRGLLNPRGHRKLLDEYAGTPETLEQVRTAWRALSSARSSLNEARKKLSEMAAEEDYLRHAVAELDALDPQAGEEAELDAKRRLMQAAEKIRTDIHKALQALGLEGAEGMLGDATRWLDNVAGEAGGSLEAPLAALERTMVELGEAQQGVERCVEALEFDPVELETIEERLFAIRGLSRKHGVAPDDLQSFLTDLRTRLDTLDSGASQIEMLEKNVRSAQRDYDATAEVLSETRESAAQKLDVAMANELAPLKMERAVFKTSIARIDPGPDGWDEVAFTVATNPGAPAGPLAKIASGGELSRFLLALKVCLTQNTDGLTLIFDEIDRGVGGATADAVGRRLSALARTGQVLVVTHSPQVAALGNHHWRVEKSQSAHETLSTVTPLARDARIDEIARMLAGDTVTSEAKAAAEALLRSV